MTTTPTKPRFPARLFKHRHKYPARYCQLSTCGKRLVPRIEKNGCLERLSRYLVRETCNLACRSALQHERGVSFGPLSPRTCSECPETFIPNSPRQKTCSPTCGYVRQLRLMRDHYREQVAAKATPKPLPEPKQERVLESRECLECGETFEPNSYNQIVCGDECRTKRTERLREKRPKAVRECSECERPFNPRGRDKLCPACREARDAPKVKPPSPPPPPEPTRADEIRAKLAELDDLERKADEVGRALIKERRGRLEDELWRLGRWAA